MTATAPVAQIPGCLPDGYDRHSFLTIRQFCTYQQIHPSTFRAWVARGKVPGYRAATKRIHVGTYEDAKIK